MQDFVDVFEGKGGLLSIELDKDFILGIKNAKAALPAAYTSPLAGWIAGGHSIAIHADTGGQSSSTVMSIKASIDTQLVALKALLGVTKIAGISGVCSHADWVQAITDLGFTYTTSVVEYCLKS